MHLHPAAGAKFNSRRAACLSAKPRIPGTVELSPAMFIANRRLTAPFAGPCNDARYSDGVAKRRGRRPDPRHVHAGVAPAPGAPALEAATPLWLPSGSASLHLPAAMATEQRCTDNQAVPLDGADQDQQNTLRSCSDR